MQTIKGGGRTRRTEAQRNKDQILYRRVESGMEKKARTAKRVKRVAEKEVRQAEKREGKRKWEKDDLIEEYPKDDLRKERREDDRPICKERPKDNRGSGGSRAFIPWCRKHR